MVLGSGSAKKYQNFQARNYLINLKLFCQCLHVSEDSHNKITNPNEMHTFNKLIKWIKWKQSVVYKLSIHTKTRKPDIMEEFFSEYLDFYKL